MSELQEIFNNREIAIGIWGMLVSRKIFNPLQDLIRFYSDSLWDMFSNFITVEAVILSQKRNS